MRIITARPHRLLDTCVERIGALVREGRRCMFLVPSQYTLQAEVELMERLDIDGTFLIDVLSPGRLRSRVFERAGEPDRVVIDERGKCMVISAILEEEKENLTVYRVSAGGANGLAQKLASLIADMKRSDVTPEGLDAAIAQMQEDAPGRKKLKDLQRIFKAYEERMLGELADEEDVARAVRAKMKQSGVVDEQHVFVYGFDVITPAFAEDLLHIATMAQSVSIAIETDKNGAPDGRLFAPVNASIERLIAMASQRGVAVQRESIDCPLAAPADIRAMEAKLFALASGGQSGVPAGVTLHAAGNPRAEVHTAASRIRGLVASGVDPAEVAIVYPKRSGYGALLSSILPMYDLNVYVAEKRAAGAHPLCRLILSALAVVSDGWRTADVVECVQSGFLPLTREEIDVICNYAEGVDLRTDAWKRDFTYIKNGTQEALDALNRTRDIIAKPLLALSQRLGEARHADDTIAAVIALLEDVDAFERLAQMREALKAQGQDALAEDCAQVWNRVMETLDQLHTLLGRQSVPAGTVLALLHSGLAAMELSALPPVDGAVICGEIGNLRTAQVKILFAIGMNDGAGGAEQSLLTPQEMEEAERATKAYLGMNASQRAALAQLDILKALSGTKEKLFVSFALADETGRALREGTAVTALRRLFPDMPVTGGLAQEELVDMLTAPRAAAQALSVMLGDAADGRGELSGEAAQAYAAIALSDGGREALAQITRKLSQSTRQRLSGTLTRGLYGRPVMSVSRLETFAQCPYKHFVRYGLSPSEEVKPGIDRAEVGTLYHEAAEQFTRAVAKLPEFPDVDADTCDALMGEAVRPLLDEWRTSPLGRSQRGIAIAAKLEKTAKRTGRNIVSQYAGGGFKPLRSELIFGQGDLAPIMLELPDGTVIYLQGRIDRVDVMDGQKIRVIDYKSGTKKFDPSMAYWGLQLQLMIYLAAALARIPGSSAAGFFYCRIADPTVRSESRIKEEIEKQIAKKLSLAGISLSDVAVLRAHGESHAAMITKDGGVSGRYASSLVDEAGMDSLVSFAKEKATSLAQDAYLGVIDDVPAELGTYIACDMCDYAAVCGFDPSRQRRRRLTPKKLGDLTGQKTEEARE